MATKYSNLLVLLVIQVLILVRADPDCGKPLPPNLLDCCNEPDWNSDISNKCPGITDPSCFMECIFNETKLLVNGELTKDTAKVIEAEIMKDTEYLPIMVKSFDDCSKMMEAHRSEMTSPGGNSCSPLAMAIADCVDEMNFLNCPTSKWRSTPECNSAKEHLQKCNV